MPVAIALILNGISRKKKFFYQQILPALADKFPIEVLETQRAGHAIELSSQACENGKDLIIAAGGDGTLNQVVNGIMLSDDSHPIVGLIPLGTGNDFAKTCKLSSDPIQLIKLIENNKPQPTDIGKIVCQHLSGGELTRYFINACSIGMGPEVVKKLEHSRRTWGAEWTYLKASTSTFFTHRPQKITIKAATWDWSGKIRVLVIANGQSFGNALYIAPNALPDDGLLNTFIAGEVPLFNFLRYQQSLKKRKKITDKLIMYNQTSNAELSSDELCMIEAEGELAGYLPARIEVLPAKIQFLR